MEAGTVDYETLLERDGRVITHTVGRSMLPLLRDRESIVIVEDGGSGGATAAPIASKALQRAIDMNLY